MHLVYCVCRRIPICFVLTNAPCFGGAQFCFPVLSRAPSLLCLPEGPNSYVLTKALRLCVSIWIGPNSVVVPTNAQVSAWRVQSVSVWNGPNSVVVLTKAQVSAWRVLSVSAWVGPNSMVVLTRAQVSAWRVQLRVWGRIQI